MRFRIVSILLVWKLVWSFPLIHFRSLLPRKATSTSTNKIREEALGIEDLKTSYSRSLGRTRKSKNVNKNTKDRTKNRSRQTKGKLILIRCGQSEYYANHTFTGWSDPSLTERGVQECEHAARLLVAEGYEIDTVYTSKLQRAIKSAWIVLEQMDALFLPVYKTFRLNQRMYGSLEGLSRKATAQSLGVDSVRAWRNSLKARPPPLSKDDPLHPIHDRRYKDLPQHLIPSSESLLECQERARPLWEHSIRPDLEAGKTVLVVAHEDSLKGLMKEIDSINDDKSQQLTIPKGAPFVYRFDKDMNPVIPEENEYPTLPNASGFFLEKPGRLSELFVMQKAWKNDDNLIERQSEKKRREASLEKALVKLRREQNLLRDLEAEEDRISDSFERWTDDPSEFEEYDFFAVSEEEEEKVTPTVVPVPRNSDAKSSREGPFVVLIRHGRYVFLSSIYICHFLK